MGWICPICSTSNSKRAYSCFVCGYEAKKRRIPFDEIESIYKEGCYYYDKGSYKKAFELLLIAAEQKYVPALVKIAECYSLGRGTPLDERKAYESYLSAAKKGDVYSQYEVARCYYYGSGTSKSLARAASWLEKAVKQEHYPSMKMLAAMYMCGEGVEQDLERAVGLYDEIADLKYVNEEPLDSDVFLGKGNCSRIEGRKITAVRYYKKAAKAGNAEAQYELALCYLNGYGVFRNVAKARTWLEASRKKGHSKAAKKLRELG